jgi:hypothetical protein
MKLSPARRKRSTITSHAKLVTGAHAVEERNVATLEGPAPHRPALLFAASLLDLLFLYAAYFPEVNLLDPSRSPRLLHP